jgi:drug/metabolite transporter (DMT)-like permease
MLAPHLNTGTLAHAMAGGPAVGALFALFGACCSAGATIQVRRLTATEKTGAIVLYFSLMTTLLGLATIVLGWRMPSWHEFGLLVGIGMLGGVGQILLTESYRYGDASLVAPFEYTTMIWALLIGWFAFDQLPAPAVAKGAMIVAATGLFVLWRERQLGLMRTGELEAAPRRTA